MRGRLVVGGIVGGVGLLACAALFDDPTQCRKDADCAGFAGARCDVTQGVCVSGRDEDGASPTDPPPVGPPDAAVDAACGPTSADPRNCGRCGHDCLGGACVSSECQAVVVATGQNMPAYVAVDATHIYWTNSGDGTIARAPRAGGASALVATGAVPRVWVIAVGGGRVFWTENGGTRVGGAPLGGGAAYAVAVAQDAPRGVATDGTRVYWTNEGPDAGVVASARTDGTDVAILSPQQAGSKDIAVRDGWLYFANSGDGTIGKLLTDGGEGSVLLSGQPGAFGLTADGARVYFTTHVDGGVVAQVRNDGTGLVTLASNQASPRAIAVDDAFVYWTNQEDGTVRRAPIGGGAVTTLASGQNEPWGIAVDGDAVYWAARGGGTIVKRAK